MESSLCVRSEALRYLNLVAGDKSGGSEKRFYNELIRKADSRFDTHLISLKVGKK